MQAKIDQGMKIALFGLLVFALLAVQRPAIGASPGFFRTVSRDGRWDLIGPDGNNVISKGVCSVSLDNDFLSNGNRSPYAEAALAKYGNAGQWRLATAKRLQGWGFNTVGAWSDPRMEEPMDGSRLAATVNVGLGFQFHEKMNPGANLWQQKGFPDVFDPQFGTFCIQTARRICSARRNDRHLLGWFTDNELGWGELWRGPGEELLVRFLNMPHASPGRRAAFAMLRRRYGAIARFNAAWQVKFSSWEEAARAKEIASPPGIDRRKSPDAPFVADCNAFLAEAADRYFKTVREAILAADPNHLLLGCRFGYVPEKPVLEAAARWMDVLSCNVYREDPSRDLARYADVRKPILIGEFYFRATDSGLPNRNAGPPTVATQEDRAAGFEKYVRAALRFPEVIGYHWFQYADHPAEGRFDGENSNCGLVTIEDRPYDILVQRMIRINAMAEELHKASSRKPGAP